MEFLSGKFLCETIVPQNELIVSRTNLKGIITYANDTFAEISGYSVDELVGNPHNIVRHPDMPKVAFKGLWDTIQSGQIWHGIVKNRAKSGDFYWVNATAYPSRTPSGELRYVSVRVKPTKEEIEFASSLYKTLK